MVYILSKNDLLANANIGKYVNFALKDNRTIGGVLLTVSSYRVDIIEDVTKLPKTISLESVEKIEIGREGSNSYSRDELRKFRNIRNQYADQPQMTFACCFRKSLERFVESCPDAFLCQYVRDELDKKTGKLTDMLIEDYLMRLEACKNVPGYDLVRTMLLFLLKEFGKAANLIYAGCEGMDSNLLRACFFAQMKDHVGTYFWLTQYLLTQEDGQFCRQHLWWYYLRRSVQFAAYEHVNDLLKKVAKTDLRVAIESMSYLLTINNSTLAALNMLGRLEEEMTTADAQDIIDFGCSFLASDTDGYYHRYVRCMLEIIGKEKITTYDGEDMVMGYVYDYIPDRKYGFIVGCDLLRYYFREESAESKRVIEETKKNICSLRISEQEDLVQVFFGRSKDTKRGYAAVRIV